MPGTYSKLDGLSRKRSSAKIQKSNSPGPYLVRLRSGPLKVTKNSTCPAHNKLDATWASSPDHLTHAILCAGYAHIAYGLRTARAVRARYEQSVRCSNSTCNPELVTYKSEYCNVQFTNSKCAALTSVVLYWSVSRTQCPELLMLFSQKRNSWVPRFMLLCTILYNSFV